MDHQRAKDCFTSYHDGDISKENLIAFEKHLETCDDCRLEWEAFEKTVSEISELIRFKPPSDFAKSVEQKIKKRSRGRFFGNERSVSTHFAVVSFILILVFMLAYLVMTAATEITLIEDTSVEKLKVDKKNEAAQ